MRAAVATVLSLALSTGACFPNNARHRTIAKVVEGGVVVGGITMLYLVNSGADCMTEIPGQPDVDCEDKASLLGNIGLGLILSGLIGFIVTVSTSEDDKVTLPAAAAPADVPPAPPPAVPAEPAPPIPAEPVPTEPAPTEPAPTEPAPTEPTEPTEPAVP